jgi:hypothetical protein
MVEFTMQIGTSFFVRNGTEYWPHIQQVSLEHVIITNAQPVNHNYGTTRGYENYGPNRAVFRESLNGLRPKVGQSVENQGKSVKQRTEIANDL